MGTDAPATLPVYGRCMGPAGPLPESCRPIGWHKGCVPCSICAGPIIGHGTFCVDCTMTGPDVALAPGVHVCEKDRSLL